MAEAPTTPENRRSPRFGLVLFTDSFGRGVTSREVFDWSLDYAAVAERHGWDELWTTEHHFTTDAQNPSALTMAAFLLGRTKLPVGTSVCALPNHHPLALAEQGALLHHLSDGRFTLGVGRGQPLVDLEILGTGMAGFRDLDPPLALLAKALRDGRAKGDGQRYAFDEVPIVPTPATDSRWPFVVSAGSSASVNLAARHGVPVILSPVVSVAEKRALLDEHAEVAAAYGHQLDPRDNLDSSYFAIGDRTAATRETLTAGLADFLVRAATSTQALVDRPIPTAEEASGGATELVDCHIAGDPAACRDQLADRIDTLGVGRVLLMPETVGSRAATLETIRRAGTEVFPAFDRQA